MPEEQKPTGQPQQEDVTVWKSRFEEAVQTRDQVRESNRLMKEQLDNVSKELNQFKSEAQKAREAEEQSKLRSQGKYEEAVKKIQEKSEADFRNLQNSATQRLVPLAIRSAATAIPNLTPEAAQDLPVLLRDYIGLDPTTLEVFVKDNEGKPLTGPDLKPVPVEQFVSEFIKTRPYLVKGTIPAQHGITGQQQQVGLDQVMSDPKAAGEFALRDPEGFAKAQAEYYSPKNVMARAKGKAK
jgi:DNA polymerase III gamma/tau subunit